MLNGDHHREIAICHRTNSSGGLWWSVWLRSGAWKGCVAYKRVTYEYTCTATTRSHHCNAHLHAVYVTLLSIGDQLSMPHFQSQEISCCLCQISNHRRAAAVYVTLPITGNQRGRPAAAPKQRAVCVAHARAGHSISGVQECVTSILIQFSSIISFISVLLICCRCGVQELSGKGRKQLWASAFFFHSGKWHATQPNWRSRFIDCLRARAHYFQ